MKKLIFISVIAFLVLIASAMAAEISVESSGTNVFEDTACFSADAASTYGAATNLHIEGKSTYNTRSYLTFNFTNVTQQCAGKNIDEAYLLLDIYLVQAGSGGMYDSLYDVYTNFSEELLTWDNQPCGTSLEISDANACNLTPGSNISIPSAAIYKWNATTIARRNLRNSAPNITMMVRMDTYTIDAAHLPRSKEAALGQKPKFNVTCSLYPGGSPPATPSFLTIAEGVHYNSFPLLVATDCAENSTIYVNGTINSTESSYYFFGGEGYFTFNASCWNDYGSSANATVNIVTDYTLPVLTVTLPLDIMNYTQLVPVDISCTDANPYLLNFTLFSSANAIMNSSQDSSAPLAISANVPIKNYVTGYYTFNASCSDSHTLNSIGDYAPKPVNNGIEFRTDAGIKLTITQASTAEPIATKLGDRYTIDFGSSKTIETRAYTITSSAPLDIIGSRYKGHMVTWSNGKGNWIDFESRDERSIVALTRINQYTVSALVGSTDFNFQSVGGLNIVAVSRTLYLDSYFPNTTINSTNTTPEAGALMTFDINCTDDGKLHNLTIDNNGSVITVNADSESRIFYNFNFTAVEGTHTVRAYCDDYLNMNSTAFLTYIGHPKPVPPSEEIEIGTCVFSTGTVIESYVIMFALLLGIAFMVVGKSLRLGLLGFAGGFIILIDAFYFYPCFFGIAACVTMAGLVSMYYFISRGYNGSL